MVKGGSFISSNTSTLGARIRVIRKSWGWTQEDLAQALGNDRQIVSYWERDKAKPTRSALALLAQLFRLPVEALTDGIGFTIPDLIDPAQGSDLVGIFREAVQSIDQVTPVGIHLVDLHKGEHKPLTLPDAKEMLEVAIQSGQTAWILIGDGQ